MTLAERAPTTVRLAAVDRSGDAVLGLGGLAAVAVVVSALRTPGLSGGWIGLELGLVLLGFATTRSLLERMAGERRWLLGHAIEVVVTVLPATVMAVGFATVWTFVQDGALLDPVRGAAIAVVGQFYDLAVVAGTVDARAFGAWWPVSMAVQLVVVAVPLVVVLRRRPARTAATVVGFVAVIAFLARVVMIGAGGAPADAVRLPWFHADGFLVGVGVALVHRRLVVTERQRLFRWTIPAVVALGVLAVVVPWTMSDAAGVLVAVPAAALLAGVVTLGLAARSVPPAATRLLAARPLVWLGRRAFGLFLWHHPVGLMLVGGGRDQWDGPWLLARQLGLTVVLALASYEFVERPLAEWIARSRPASPKRP